MAEEGSATGYTYTDVARIPAFRLLWLGDLASQTADRMVFVAVTILVYGGSSSSTDVSLVMGAYFLPAVFFSIPGGVFADRFARRTVMVVAEAVRMGIALMMAFLGTDVVLIAMVLAFSSLTYLFYPSRQASIPCLVPEGALMPANAAISANLIMGFALGPVIGGVVASMHGAEVSLVCAAVVMATGVALIAMIREPTICTPARDASDQGPSSVSEGLREIRSHVRLWQGLMLVVFVMLAVGAGAVGLVILGDDVLDLGGDGFPILLSALAVGTLAGAIFIGSLGTTPFKGRFLIGSTILAGAMMFTISGVDQLIPALVVMFLMGIAAAMVLVPFTTMLQEDLGDTVMGTGFGLLSMGLTTPILVGVAIAGPFIEARGVQDLFMVMGFLLGIVGIITLVASSLWSAPKERD